MENSFASRKLHLFNIVIVLSVSEINRRNYFRSAPLDQSKIQFVFFLRQNSFTCNTHTHTHTHIYIYIYIYINFVVTKILTEVFSSHKQKCLSECNKQKINKPPINLTINISISLSIYWSRSKNIISQNSNAIWTDRKIHNRFIAHLSVFF